MHFPAEKSTCFYPSSCPRGTSGHQLREWASPRRSAPAGMCGLLSPSASSPLPGASIPFRLPAQPPTQYCNHPGHQRGGQARAVRGCRIRPAWPTRQALSCRATRRRKRVKSDSPYFTLMPRYPSASGGAQVGGGSGGDSKEELARDFLPSCRRDFTTYPRSRSSGTKSDFKISEDPAWFWTKWISTRASEIEPIAS